LIDVPVQLASLGTQRAFDELERPGGGGETPPFRTAVLELGVNHMGRDQLAELAPGGPIALAGSLDCAVEYVAGDVRQNDRMPSYRGVLAVFGEKIPQPCRFPVKFICSADPDLQRRGRLSTPAVDRDVPVHFCGR
jgi:hypothetical protein